jgi:hypothetical protein
MDFRIRDDKGLTICPNCKKHYKPELGERNPELLVVKQYPDATEEQRQQLISGLCSNKCYKEYTTGDNNCWLARLDDKRLPDELKEIIKDGIKVSELKKILLNKGISTNPDQARNKIFRWLSKGELHKVGPGAYNFLLGLDKSEHEVIDDWSVLPKKIDDFLSIPKKVFKLKAFMKKNYLMRRAEADNTIKLWFELGLLKRIGDYVSSVNISRLMDDETRKFINSKPAKMADLRRFLMKKYDIGSWDANNLIVSSLGMSELHIQSGDERNPFIGLSNKLLMSDDVKKLLEKSPVKIIQLKNLLMKKYRVNLREAEEIIDVWIIYDDIVKIDGSHSLSKKF